MVCMLKVLTNKFDVLIQKKMKFPKLEDSVNTYLIIISLLKVVGLLNLLGNKKFRKTTSYVYAN